MADSQDRQKESDDAKGRGCNESHKVGDQVITNTTNLHANVVSAVFKTKSRTHFIGHVAVVAKKGPTYTLNLLRKLCAHFVFYIGVLRPYRDPSHVNVEALAPRKATGSQVATSKIGA